MQEIPKSYYVKTAPVQIFSPQHWAQMSSNNTTKNKGIWCATYDDTVVLHWHQNTRKHMIQLDPDTNTATIYSSSGYNQVTALSSEVDDVEEHEPCLEFFESGIISEDECFNIGVVMDDEGEDNDHESYLSEGQDKSVLSAKQQHKVLSPDNLNTPRNMDFDIEQQTHAPNVIINEEGHEPQDVSMEFLRWHH